jgi:phenylalanyl-tRNA synthetase beta chain
MKASLHWIKKFIDFNASKEEIGNWLTDIGLEVESMEDISSIKGGLAGVVVGHVVECSKHPDADKLSITKVDIGSGGLQQIVCGAPNVAAGQKVFVATVGCTLYPNGGDALTIKKAKIRGVESNGMICASDELGMGSDHSGIMVLPEDYLIGKPASEFVPVLNDTIFEIGLTPNRSDATCHAGIARDLYAYVKVNKDSTATFREPVALGFSGELHNYQINVNLKRPDLCPRFTGISITNVEIKESPAWLKNQLKVLGIKSINNVVDVTNYILHELGQPLHAYDADKISGKTINVDVLPKGYKYVGLDGRIFELTGDELMINDGDYKGMCIGGVFGGIDSGIQPETKNIFLEAAHFNQQSIRKSSMHHNLRTDAAKVFEKGSDPNVCVNALKRATALIVELTGGTISSEVIDVYPKEIAPKEIHVKYANINRILGMKIPSEKVHEILNALNIRITPIDDQSFKAYITTNKSDVVREIDVIEEILRIYGFNMIPISHKLSSTISYAANPDKVVTINNIAGKLSAQGFNEMMGLSLIDSKLCKEALEINSESLVYINNTSNIGLDVMRPSMLLSGLLSLAHNINRQQSSLKLYEIGKSYSKNGEEFNESERFSIYMTGSNDTHWSNPKAIPYSFLTLKSVVNGIITGLGIKGIEISESEEKGLSYGLTYTYNKKPLVSFGEVDKSVAKKTGVKQTVFYAEFDIMSIMQSQINKTNYVSEISKFPHVKRDLAVVIDKQINFDAIEKAIKGTKQKYLTKIGLFDIYTNEEVLGKGKKSYALNFEFENLEATLTEKEIESSMSKIIKVCEETLGATIRGNG